MESLCNDIGLNINGKTDEQLHEEIKLATRERCLAFWHDHATILGHGYLLVTVPIMYNNSLFQKNTCQAIIEEPEIHMIALSSSSAEDQVAFIPDRYECLEELSEILYSSRGVPVKDVCRFFLGDHPAQNFERGTQNGGHYKCGGCGIRSSMIGDFAHAARLSWRSLGDIQALAVGGSFGRQAKKLKPLIVSRLIN